MSAGWRAIRWAKTVPPVRRKDGKPDSVAQHVLLVLATFAGKDGRARPGLSTLASETYLTDETVDAALDRLLAAGLIARGGLFNGTTVWSLNMLVGPDGTVDSELAERRERARVKRNERQRRFKERRQVTASDTVTDGGPGGRYLTGPDTVTHLSGNGVEDRQVTVSEGASNGVGHRQVTVPTSSSPQVAPAVTAIELPLNCQRTASTPKLAVDDEFDAFWDVYPRKEKKLAAKDAYLKAIQGNKRKKRPSTDPATVLAGARRYAARCGTNPQYIAMPTTWLNDGRWEDQPTDPTPAVANGYQPWANPSDQSAYDEELLP